MFKKKLPPYGAPILSAIEQGLTPINDIYLFCGRNAWHKATGMNKQRPTLCLPPWEDPSIFDWPVKNCDILILDTGGSDQDYIDAIAASLFACKASIIRVVTSENNIYRFIK